VVYCNYILITIYGQRQQRPKERQEKTKERQKEIKALSAVPSADFV